jgi:hypothetical protein
MLESSIESVFREVVKSNGGMPIKLMPTEVGLPDRIAVWPDGRVQFVELKTRGGVVSPKQRVIHKRLRDRHVEVFVLWSAQQVRDWARYRGLPPAWS